MQRLSDVQRERIRERFPEENTPDGRPGRKPVPARQVLDGVPWILNTGAQSHVLPQCYPNCKTVHRRFRQRCQQEVLRAVLADLADA
jgi:transposase